MLTDFEVRQRMDSIRMARLAPLRKARLLLRLGRSLSPQVKSLSAAKSQIAKTSDLTTTAGLTRMATNAARLRESLRDAAFDALCAKEDRASLN